MDVGRWVEPVTGESRVETWKPKLLRIPVVRPLIRNARRGDLHRLSVSNSLERATRAIGGGPDGRAGGEEDFDPMEPGTAEDGLGQSAHQIFEVGAVGRVEEVDLRRAEDDFSKAAGEHAVVERGKGATEERSDPAPNRVDALQEVAEGPEKRMLVTE